jgi:hypothetical protein
MSDILGPIRKVTPSDTPLEPFKYIQAGVSGTVIIETTDGVQTTVTSALLDKVAIVPVGVHNKVTGGTATDIYVWS